MLKISVQYLLNLFFFYVGCFKLDNNNVITALLARIENRYVASLVDVTMLHNRAKFNARHVDVMKQR